MRPNSSYLVSPALAMASASSTHMVSSREEKETRSAGLKVLLEVMTCDLSALKNGTK